MEAAISLGNAACPFKIHYKLRCISKSMLSTASTSRSWNRAYSMRRTCSWSTQINQSWTFYVWDLHPHLARPTTTFHNNPLRMAIKMSFSSLATDNCPRQQTRTLAVSRLQASVELASTRRRQTLVRKYQIPRSAPMHRATAKCRIPHNQCASGGREHRSAGWFSKMHNNSRYMYRLTTLRTCQRLMAGTFVLGLIVDAGISLSHRRARSSATC